MTTRLHRAELSRRLGVLARGYDLDMVRKDIERHLGYPLAEASLEELRGVVAALAAVQDAHDRSAFEAREPDA